MTPELPDLRTVQRVVLVEGDSDAAAVSVTADALGRTELAVVAMGGATNIRHYLLALQPFDRDVVGLCDALEARGFRRALAHVGRGTDLAAAGFAVCDADLEDEYLRSLGTSGVLQVVAEAGDVDRFDFFSRQPAQRDRSLHDRLHRFLGTRSGRKIRYGSLLAQAANPDRIPPPVRAVLTARDAPTIDRESAGTAGGRVDDG